MWEIIWHAFLESVILIPFLLCIYLLIEWLEHNKKMQEKTITLLNGKLAPVIAGSVGLIPQCGFSVVATKLYLQKYIKMGTLLALFVATSDEALPLLLANQNTFVVAWVVLGIKVVYAIILGYIVNIFDKRQLANQYEDCHAEGCCNHDINHHQHGFWNFVKHPLIHTALIFLYVVIINIICALILHEYEQSIMNFMSNVKYAQPLIVALIGLIPNCGSSVLIAQLYSQGIINFGAMLAGLCVNSGIALAVLIKDRTMWKSNLLLIALLYLSGVLIGTLFSYVLPNSFVL